MRGDVEGAVHRGGRLQQHVDGQSFTGHRSERGHHTIHVPDGLDLGHHQMTQPMPDRARNRADVGLKRRMG